MSKNKPVYGLTVQVGDLPINIALKKFKQKIDDSGKLEELKKRMFFEKPTTERKRKKGAARARWLKKLGEQQRFRHSSIYFTPNTPRIPGITNCWKISSMVSGVPSMPFSNHHLSRINTLPASE